MDVRTWEDMKRAMTRQFVPIDYRQRVQYQFTKLTQGSMTVEEYTSRFYHLAAQSEFPWSEDLLITMYRRGLHSNIAEKLVSSRFLSLADVVQVAHQIVEEQNAHVSPTRPNFLRNPESRSERHYTASEKMKQPISTPQASPKASTFEASKKKEGRCFKCDKAGHYAHQCPQRNLAMAQAHDDFENLCAVPYDDDDIEVHEPEYDEELEHCGVIRPMLSTHATEDDKE
uniref:CCHC-type domain-containing protein n=1 Tax=Ananas comosus var. bracteatus TaxID=296719 RepID=A0A6V7NXW5_ANACO|nr:unnamed protein product [Ananas comosus var. bracteatus]